MLWIESGLCLLFWSWFTVFVLWILTPFYESFIIKECLFTWQTTNILILFSLHLYYFQTNHFLCYLHRLGIRCHQKKYPELLHRVSLYFWNIVSLFLSVIFACVHDFFRYFAETCIKLNFKLIKNGHQVLKFWSQTFLNDLPHFPELFLQIIFASIYIFHLHITLINAPSQALKSFSLTLSFYNLGNPSIVSGYITSFFPVKPSHRKQRRT